MTDITVAYEPPLRFRATHAEPGAVLVMDGPRELGGTGESFSPSDLLSLSLGGCILGIMAVAARSMDIDISGATAAVSKEMGGTPRRITHLSVIVRVPGAFDERQRRKLEAAAHACPVHNALGIDAPIVFDWVG
ncbi:OsmC family protein [Sphingomonas sp. LR60]|uniref:OsmC family protein n=1 Tax=Sphingomonas sp. LR60 TaxID=3050233 RepID=UPI002FE1BBD2